MLGAIDKRNVDVFQVFRWRVMNDRRESAQLGAASEASKRTAASTDKSLTAIFPFARFFITY
jgi:hypothetical protein